MPNTIVKLENVYRQRRDEIPIVLVDTRVFLCAMMNEFREIENIVQFPEKTVECWFAARWCELINDPLPWLRYGLDQAQVILADDYKNSSGKYWRSLYYPPYKGNRLPESERPATYSACYRALMAHLDHSAVEMVREYSFEADDIAASLVHVSKKHPARTIFLATSDGDWSGLVNDRRRIMFANALHYTPRLKSEAEVFRWQGAKPPNVAMHKHIHGDAGDNIAPGGTTPIGVIDLINPSERPRQETLDQLEAMYLNPVNTLNKDQLRGARRYIESFHNHIGECNDV